MPVYTGVGGAVRTVNSIRTGVGGVVRTVNNGHIGINGVNRQFMSYRLSDVDYFCFKHRGIYIYGMEKTSTSDSGISMYTSHKLGEVVPTSSGYLLSDINSVLATDTNGYVKTPNNWRIVLETTNIIEYLLKGSAYNNTAITNQNGNIEIIMNGPYSPIFKMYGSLYVVLKDGTSLIGTTFFPNSDAVSAQVIIAVYRMGSGSGYNILQTKFPIFGHTFFETQNGETAESHIYSLDDLKNSAYWQVDLGVIAGEAYTEVHANTMYGTAYTWRFTDTDGNTFNFDKTKVRFTTWL